MRCSSRPSRAEKTGIGQRLVRVVAIALCSRFRWHRRRLWPLVPVRRYRRRRIPIPMHRPALPLPTSAAVSSSVLAIRRPTAWAAHSGIIPAAAARPRPPKRRGSGPGARPTEFRREPARRATSSAISVRPGAALPGSARALHPASMSAFRSTRAIPPSTFRWRCNRPRSISPSSVSMPRWTRVRGPGPSRWFTASARSIQAAIPASASPRPATTLKSTVR